VIAFTGVHGGLMMPAFDFFKLTQVSRYSRILLLDTTRTCYMGGLPPLYEGYSELLAGLRASIERLSPRQIVCIGASGGAFAALRFGHELKADYVHAFSPYSYVGRSNVEKFGDQDSVAKHPETIDRIDALPRALHPLFDLQPDLARHNGKSRYYLHVCRRSRWDVMRAKHLRRCPGVTIIGYPCGSHGVAATLAHAGLLGEVLKMENQDQLPRKLGDAIARLHESGAEGKKKGR
jgi:hypothetical protein